MKNKELIEFHDVANIFPMMSTKELEALKQDLSVNGLREPIWLYKGKIIDGRNRYIGCLESKTKTIFRNYEGSEDELINFVISLNLHRRHLTTSQKACLAVNILPELEKQTKSNLSKKMSAIRKGETEVSAKLQNLNSSQTASKIFGVSERYIFDAKKLKSISELLFNEVQKGLFTLQQAKKQLNNTEDSAKLQNPNKHNTNEVPAILQNLEQTNLLNTDIKLSRYEQNKVKELVIELGISEPKAIEYIIKKRTSKNTKSSSKLNKTADFKEIKVRIPQEEKDKIQLIAKQQNKTVSDLLRELFKTSLI